MTNPTSNLPCRLPPLTTSVDKPKPIVNIQVGNSPTNRLQYDRLVIGEKTSSNRKILNWAQLESLRPGDMVEINEWIQDDTLAINPTEGKGYIGDVLRANTRKTYRAEFRSITERTDGSFLMEVIPLKKPNDDKQSVPRLVVIRPGADISETTVVSRIGRPWVNWLPQQASSRRVPPQEENLWTLYSSPAGSANPYGAIIDGYLRHPWHSLDANDYFYKWPKLEDPGFKAAEDTDALAQDCVGPVVLRFKGWRKSYEITTSVQSTVLAARDEMGLDQYTRGYVVIRLTKGVWDHLRNMDDGFRGRILQKPSLDGLGMLLHVSLAELHRCAGKTAAAVCIAKEDLARLPQNTRITVTYSYSRTTTVDNSGLPNSGLPVRFGYAHLPAVVLEAHDGWLDVCAPWDHRTLSADDSPLQAEGMLWEFRHPAGSDFKVPLLHHIQDVKGPKLKEGTEVAPYDGSRFSGQDGRPVQWYRFQLVHHPDAELGFRFDCYFPQQSLEPRAIERPAIREARQHRLWETLQPTQLAWIDAKGSPLVREELGLLDEKGLQELEEGEVVFVDLANLSVDSKGRERSMQPAKATLLDRSTKDGETTLIFGLESARISMELITLKINANFKMPLLQRPSDTVRPMQSVSPSDLLNHPQSVRWLTLVSPSEPEHDSRQGLSVLHCQDGFFHGTYWVRPLPGDEPELLSWSGIRTRRQGTEFLVTPHEFTILTPEKESVLLNLKHRTNGHEVAVVFGSRGEIEGTMWIRAVGDGDKWFSDCIQRERPAGRERLVAMPDFDIKIITRRQVQGKSLPPQESATPEPASTKPKDFLTRVDCRLLPVGQQLKVGDLFTATFLSVPENSQLPHHIRVEAPSGYGDWKGIQGIDEAPYFNNTGLSSYLVDLELNHVSTP